MRVETIKVLDRALAVLGLLAMHQKGLTLTQISAGLKMPKSTARRFLHTLLRRDFIEAEPSTERYRIGSALVGLSRRTPRDSNLAALAQPVLEQLSERTGETAALNVRFGDARICLAQSEGRERLRYVMQVGESAPLYAGAQGKLLLSALDERALSEYLFRTHLAPLAHETITDPEVLRAELVRIRAQGYALAAVELTTDAAAIAAGVQDRIGRTVAAIGVAGPAMRLTPARLGELTPMVREAAEEVSRRLAS